MRLLFSKLSVPATLLLFILTGCHTVPPPSNTNSNVAIAPPQRVPFTVSIVPTRSASDSRIITIAKENPPEFYVVLTNVSNEPQPVWEMWNSWGSKTISFEFNVANNQPVLVTRGPEDFTRNFPSTFVIPPAEHQVYSIRLDKWWVTTGIPKSTEASVRIKAIYEVSKTPETSQYNVWVGRIESPYCQITLRQW